MVARARREEALVNELRSAEHLTASELALRLGVSTRSIRGYVKEINAGADRPPILSDQRGYALDPRCGAEDLGAAAPRQEDADQRLYHVVRRLVTEREPIDVFEIGDELVVSQSTVEADLGRVRELLHVHRLAMHRRGGYVWIAGPERQQRRLVRHLLLNTGTGAAPAGAFAVESGDRRHEARVRGLRARVRAALRDAGVEVNEYALQDLLLHLVIAVERVSSGRLLPADAQAGTVGEDVQSTDPTRQVTRRVACAVEDLFEVALPERELHDFHSLLTSRSRAASAGANPLGTEAVTFTRESLRALSSQFMLDLYDEQALAGIALHVQSLIERARAGTMHDQPPLGQMFQRMHPLIHELALCLARELEVRAAIRVEPGEIDFLAIHLGNQVLRQMEHGPPVTITLVLPEYGRFSSSLEQEIIDALPDSAAVTDVVTDLSHDWKTIVSDLVVSVVDLVPAPPSPVVQIGPFLTDDDRRRVAEAVRSERRRSERDTLRTHFVSLLDPRLFVRVEQATKDECLATLAGLLHEEGYVGEDFLDGVLDREARSSTVFGPMFALPHSISMDARKTGIAVLVADKPIPWDGASVRLVLMFAIGGDGRVVFRDVLDELIQLLSMPASVRGLVKNGAEHGQFVRQLLDLVGE